MSPTVSPGIQAFPQNQVPQSTDNNANTQANANAAQPQSVPTYVPQPATQTGAVPPVPVYQMPYSQFYAQQPQKPIYPQAPSYNAVKIDINGASVNAGGTPQTPAYPGMYQPVPQMQTVPPVPAFPYIPVPMTQTGAVPPQPVPPVPVAQTIPQTQPQNIIPPPIPTQVPPQPPVSPVTAAPVETPQSTAVPTPPPPAIDDVKTEEPAKPEETKETDKPKETEETKTESVEDNAASDETVKPLVDALAVINKPDDEINPTSDEVTKAIQTIATYAKAAQNANDLAQENPDASETKEAKDKADNMIKPLLIKEETFKGLAGVAVKDTSELPEDEKKKADENRIISMWTLAMLQKLFRQEMNQEAEKIDIPPISMNEIPGIVQVVNNVKSDPNPEVREAGIVALMNVADPKDKKDVETMNVILKTAAKQDKSDEVKKAAKDALKTFQK